MHLDVPYSPEEVADRLAIQDVMARYAHGLDARDYDALDGVFLANAIIDLTDAGSPRGTWLEIKPFYEANLRNFVYYFHAITNMQIEFNRDRSEARSVSKVINPVGMLGEDGQVHFFETIGHHHDSWRKTPEGWRISERRWQSGWVWGDYPFDHEPGDFSSPRDR